MHKYERIREAISAMAAEAGPGAQIPPREGAGPAIRRVDHDSAARPTNPHRNRLDFTNDAGGAPDKTMGLFYLQRNEDGSWTIVGYLRQYM